MLPEHLVANYWVEVQLELTTRFGLSAPDAAAVVRDFRRKLDGREMSDMIYHTDATELADALGHGWKNGSDNATRLGA